MKRAGKFALCAALGLLLLTGNAAEAEAKTVEVPGIEVSYWCKPDPQSMIDNAVRVPVKTGDQTQSGNWLVLGAVSGLTILFLLGKRRRKEDASEE